METRRSAQAHGHRGRVSMGSDPRQQSLLVNEALAKMMDSSCEGRRLWTYTAEERGRRRGNLQEALPSRPAAGPVRRGLQPFESRLGMDQRMWVMCLTPCRPLAARGHGVPAPLPIAGRLAASGCRLAYKERTGCCNTLTLAAIELYENRNWRQAARANSMPHGGEDTNTTSCWVIVTRRSITANGIKVEASVASRTRAPPKELNPLELIRLIQYSYAASS